MKFSRPRYIKKVSPIQADIELQSGEKVNVYTINPNLTDDEKKEWAKHILAHFISEEDISKGARLRHITTSEYIKNFVLPSKKLRKGGEVSGIFGEILFSDFIEFILDYTVPRYKLYGSYPGNPNQGIDIVAYKFDTINHDKDAVLFAEIKARLSTTNYRALQNAINDIENRDDLAKSLALDTARRKLEQIGCYKEAQEVARFEDSEKPCVRISAAGLVTSASDCPINSFLTNDKHVGVSIHQGNQIETYVIYSTELIKLARNLWRKACQ